MSHRYGSVIWHHVKLRNASGRWLLWQRAIHARTRERLNLDAIDWEAEEGVEMRRAQQASAPLLASVVQIA